MLTDEIRRFISRIPLAIVATSGGNGRPHLALGSDFSLVDNQHVVFQNWFCQTTLQNLEANPRVALAVMQADTGTGYQFEGVVVRSSHTAILDGYTPGEEPVIQPQSLTRLVVRVEQVLAFCSGLHTDLPLGSEMQGSEYGKEGNDEP